MRPAAAFGPRQKPENIFSGYITIYSGSLLTGVLTRFLPKKRAVQ
jgi:hypothetical protein